MTRPRRIKVGCFSYAVLNRDGGDNLGECDHDALKIHIQSGQPIDGERETVFHELLHACLHLTGAGMSEKREERLVRALSPVLLDVLNGNPTLRTYLFG